MRARPYSPPEGYYDLPFSWVYDGTGLTDGQDALNQFVYLQGGYGEFYLRRAMGFDRCLLAAAGEPGLQGGRFRLYDHNGNPKQSEPIYAYGWPNGLTQTGLPDWGFPFEERYPELGKIAFDLYSVQKDANPLTAQIAFKGVRRMQGSPRKVNYKHQPKYFTYNTVIALNSVPGLDVILRQQIRDYDFELFDIRLLRQLGASVSVGGEGVAVVTFVANPQFSGSFTIELVINGLPPNSPFSLNVVPNTSITIQGATDAGGIVTTTVADMIAAFNANADAVAMASVSSGELGFLMPELTPPAVLTSTGFEPLTAPIANLWVRDSDRIAISSRPMLDIFWAGGISPYGEGSIVPPLLYPKDQQIQVDISPLTTDQQNLMIQFVGRQLIPC